jgi:hypothetical protein
MDSVCHADGCERPIDYRGQWCAKHYQRALKWGDPTITRTPLRGITDPAAFLAEKSATDGECVIWLGKPRESGYCVATFRGEQWRIHRLAYQTFVGPLDPELTVDHLCKRRACIRPDHLEQVTAGENALRGDGPPAQHARRTHCINGHEFDLTRNGGRYRACSTCARERQRRYRQRKG